MNDEVRQLSEPSEGAEAPPQVVAAFTLRDIVRYAGASGDFNPVHYDRDLARSLGHRDLFAMGMLPAGILGEYITDWLGPIGVVHSIRFRFVDRVWLGEEHVCRARIDRLEYQVDETTIHIDGRFQSVDGTDKITAACTVETHAREGDRVRAGGGQSTETRPDHTRP